MRTPLHIAKGMIPVGISRSRWVGYSWLALLLLGACEEPLIDGDGDGHSAAADCDDDDPLVHPDAEEICDDIDNNCDGSIDEPTSGGAQAWWADRDGDGFGDPDGAVKACDEPLGFVDNDLDCNDNNGDVHPNAVEEIGDGIDNDCDPETSDE